MNSGFVTGPPPAEPRAPWVPGFVISITLVIVGVGMLALWVGERRRQGDVTAKMVEASYNRRIATADLLTLLESAESAQRGYVITGDSVFLRLYGPARGALLRHLEDLRQSYTSDRSQLARLSRLELIITAKTDEMAEVIQRRTSGDRDGASARVGDGQGRQLMQDAYAIVRQLIVVEDRTLAAALGRSRAQAAALDRVIWVLICTVAVILPLAIVARLRGRLAHHDVEMQAYETLIRLRAIFASTSEAMLVLNPSGTVEDVNAAGTRLLGYDTAALKRQDVSLLLDIADGEGPFHRRVGIVDGMLQEPTRLDRIARHRDGTEVPVDVALGLMPLTDGLHVVALLRNVSERKEAERLKDAFISTVSHELRTPLTSVVGALGLLRGGAAGELAGPVRRLVDIAESNSRRLIRLINDILDVDRIGSGQARIEMAATDMGVIARTSADDARGLAAARGVRIALDLPSYPVMTRGDAHRLSQVIGNLLSNAIRFSPDQGTITLSLAQRDNRVLLHVDDQGAGIAPEFRDRIFGRFAQSDAGAAIAGGSGLGLAISREIIKAHGGEIWFEDVTVGAGTRFSIALPVLAGAPEAQSQEGPLILHVDDDPDMRQVTALALAAKGRVVGAGSIAAARAIVAAQAPDLVILDINLPDGAGLDLLPDLLAIDGKMPVIIYSASELPPGDRSRFNAVLVKSRRSAAALSDAVEEALARRRLEESPSFAG